MADGVARLFSDLEASFEGSVARDESRAATDLALSLRQDLRIYDRVSSWGAAVVKGSPQRVSEVALDHVVMGDPPQALVPLEAAVLMPADARGEASIRRSDQTLVRALKPWVKAARRVRVATSEGRSEGRIVAATPDHILIAHRTQMLIPYASIRRISLFPEG